MIRNLSIQTTLIMKYFFLLFLAILFIFCSCSDDDVMIVTETITVRDTVIVVQHDTTTVIQRDTTIVVERDTIIDIVSEDSSVVVICVRHAETTGIGTNPMLSALGILRAQDLSNALSNIDLAAVYSTNFNRTRETAQVTADDQGESVIIYNAFDLVGLSNNLLANHKGETILVVGHSNTTPQLINQLTGTTTYATFNENTYDNLFIVNVKITGEAVVHHLEYGKDTP